MSKRLPAARPGAVGAWLLLLFLGSVSWANAGAAIPRGDRRMKTRRHEHVTLHYSPESEPFAGEILAYAAKCSRYLARLFGQDDPLPQSVHWLARADWRGKPETYGFPYASGPDAFLPAADVDLPDQLALCTEAMDIEAGGDSIRRVADSLGLPAGSTPADVRAHLSGSRDFFVVWTAWQILPHELTHGYCNALGYPQEPRWWYEGLAQWAAYRMQRDLRSEREAEMIYQCYQLLWERAGDRLKVRDFAEADRVGASGLETPNYAWYHAGLLRMFRELEAAKGGELLPGLVGAVGRAHRGQRQVAHGDMIATFSGVVGRDLHTWFADGWNLRE